MRIVAGGARGLRRRLGGRRSALRLGLVTLVIAAAVTGALLLTRGPARPPNSVSFDPQSWSLPRLSGSGQVTLAGFRGHPLVLAFFASWCTSCETELPQLAGLARRFAGRVTFAGVNAEETGNGVAMAARTGIGGWPLARDTGGRELSGLRDALEPTPGMPITAYYDSGGRLLRVQLGAQSGDTVTRQIAALFHLRPS